MVGPGGDGLGSCGPLVVPGFLLPWMYAVSYLSLGAHWNNLGRFKVPMPRYPFQVPRGLDLGFNLELGIFKVPFP